ncbi:MAG: type VI secretion system contractile sheath small subunit [Isosphaeraceae bacterium]
MPPRGKSLQHEIDNKRPPRVQITYDVEIGDAIEKRELPFVVGVMADLSGHPAEPLPPLSQRKFVEINRDNFDKVMSKVGPRLAMKVDNRLEKDGSKLGLELKFEAYEDFEPENVVKQVEPLRKLLEARQRLADLKTKVIANDRLDNLLQQIMQSTESLQRLEAETRAATESPEQEG